MKILIVLIVFIILATLISAFVAMMRGGDSRSSVFYKSLQFRIILTVCLMIFLVSAIMLGWIEPNKVVLDRPPS